jgi:nicotinate-nucleotide pyrophosphorylase (carboxylating)
MKGTSQLDRVIRQALAEDRAARDLTTNALVGSAHRSKAVIFSKEEAVACGLTVAKRVFELRDAKTRIRLHGSDGQKVKKGQTVLTVEGPTRALLSAERTVLNFLSYLSAIATKTGRFVDRVKPFKTQILDTRKTTPTLRFLERYAVRCGGGVNHRDNLSDMMMIKDNHLLVAGQSIAGAVKAARRNADVALEVEVDTLAQFKNILGSGADIILLDNMAPKQIREAVRLRDRAKSRVLLEASGGIDLSNVRVYAQTGVDRLSIGGLTHSRDAIDFSMEIR